MIPAIRRHLHLVAALSLALASAGCAIAPGGEDTDTNEHSLDAVPGQVDPNDPNAPNAPFTGVKVTLDPGTPKQEQGGNGPNAPDPQPWYYGTPNAPDPQPWIVRAAPPTH